MSELFRRINIMTCGIYGIRNKIDGNMYIGQSCNIENRYNRHNRELERGIHHNKYLQRSYFKYGSIAFELLILEESNKELLSKKEQEWINKNPKEKLYNQVFDVQYRQGESNPFFGRNHTEDAKLSMSRIKKQNYIGKGNPNYGKRHSINTRIKMSENRGKINIQTILEIKQLLLEGKFSHQQIASKFSVGRTTITRISSGTRWANITKFKKGE